MDIVSDYVSVKEKQFTSDIKTAGRVVQQRMNLVSAWSKQSNMQKINRPHSNLKKNTI